MAVASAQLVGVLGLHSVVQFAGKVGCGRAQRSAARVVGVPLTGETPNQVRLAGPSSPPKHQGAVPVSGAFEHGPDSRLDQPVFRPGEELRQHRAASAISTRAKLLPRKGDGDNILHWQGSIPKNASPRGRIRPTSPKCILAVFPPLYEVG
jgi:hypothetical protein